MENENENLNSTNEENVDELDTDALKEKYQQLNKEKTDLLDKNKQLFVRAKKAEGFEQDGEGNWVKTIEKTEKPKKPEAKLETGEDFGLLEKTFLRSAGITEPDEIELARKLQEETGKGLDALIEHGYFKAELESLRQEKKNTKATSGVRGGGSSATKTPEHWIAKGVPPTSEQVPDRKERAKIARAMMEASKSGKKFYNE